MSRRQGEKGYSLAELLVVLAIVALIAGLSLPLIRPKPKAIELQTIAQKIASSMRTVRSEAISSNLDKFISIDLQSRQYWYREKQKQAIPSYISLSLLSAREETIQSNVGRIRFFADGGSSGGKLVLKYKNQSVTIAIDWLTGAVTLE